MRQADHYAATLKGTIVEGQSFLCLAVEGLWADTKQQIIMSMKHYLYLYCIYKYIYIYIYI